MSSRDERVSTQLDGAVLDRLWDAMNRGIAPVVGSDRSASFEAAETIRLVLQHDDAPALDLRSQNAIWTTITAAAQAPDVSIERQPGHAFAETVLSLLQRGIRQTAIGVIGGMLMGFIVIGGGLRVLMRLAAMLTDTDGHRMVTENGNTVGAITLEGTLALMIFVGLPFGVVGGVLLMVVRPWLPSNGWLRYALVGLVGFALTGATVLDYGHNPDYERFGILGMNICLFTLLPVLFGITALPLLDRLDRYLPYELPSGFASRKQAAASVAMIVLALPIVLIVPAAIGIPPLGLLLALPAIRFVGDWWARSAATRPLRQKREAWGVLAGRIALAIPLLVGLLLTAQAVGRLAN